MDAVLESQLSSKVLISPIEELIEEIRLGKMIVLLDDEDRENEGDLVMAARHITPEAVNFMAQFGRGLICMPMSKERGKQLALPLMVQDNLSPYGTNFTVSIEASTGVTTGISAADRARTIEVAANLHAEPDDLVKPGHVFPLLAKPGGVLSRAGHTEAAVDLVQLAKAGDSGVLVEILNEDGSMARRDDCLAFAASHQLKVGTIADLIHYRLANEQTVIQQVTKPVQTDFGPMQLFVFKDTIEGESHYALVKGQPENATLTTVRVHLADTLGDLLSIQPEEAGWRAKDALREIAKSEVGVFLLLGKPNLRGATQHLIMNAAPSIPTDRKDVGVGAQILHQLGVRKMRLLSNNKQFYALSGYELEVVETISSQVSL